MKKVNIVIINAIILGVIIWSLYFLRPMQQNIEYILQDKDSQISVQMDSFEQLERYKQDLHREYQSAVESMDKKFNVIIVVIGIALSVWVSLNIYSVVQKEEISRLSGDLENIKNELKLIKEETSLIDKGIKTSINILKEETDRGISLVKIETNYLQLKNTQSLIEKKDLIEEVMFILEKYPGIKNNDFKAEIYLDYATIITGILLGFSDVIGEDERRINFLIDESMEKLDEALRITTNIILKSNIHREYSRIAHNLGELDTALYHSEKVYDENPWDVENLMELLKILDDINEPRYFFKLLNLIQEYIEYINVYPEKEMEVIIKEKIKEYEIENIYKSKYGKEFRKLIE